MAPPQLNTTAANSPSPPPLLSPTGKPTHLQPLETSSAWHGSSQGSLPTTPKSNLGPQGVAVTRLGSTASLRYSASDISVASLSQVGTGSTGLQRREALVGVQQDSIPCSGRRRLCPCVAAAHVETGTGRCSLQTLQPQHQQQQQQADDDNIKGGIDALNKGF